MNIKYLKLLNGLLKRVYFALNYLLQGFISLEKISGVLETFIGFYWNAHKIFYVPIFMNLE